MSKIKSLLILLLFLFSGTRYISAASGDTTWLQTFTFGSQQDSVFNFPDDTKEYSKILMYYKLKCNPAQNPACGEWDYLTYTYLYQPTGKYDSTVSKIDTSFDTMGNVLNIDTLWKKFEVQNRFEIGRYITPYGKMLDLGAGITWIFDVSDYASLLKNKVHLTAGNWQELLDLKFAFIEGTPARKPYKVENVWTGNFPYGGSKSIETYLSEKKITIDKDASEVRMKVRVTGHGFGGNENCSEFCPKTHSLMVDGAKRWSQLVWRDNCAYNNVFPQGGTWVYNRANWCPGAEVETYNIELTPYVSAGKQVSLDYDVEPYTWNGQGSVPYYATEIQLVYYTKNKFENDASVEDIITPSSKDQYSRLNPTCAQPEVILKNNGSKVLEKIDLHYGVKGGPIQNYSWAGSLQPYTSEKIVLPLPEYYGSGLPTFKVWSENPNGVADENPHNDTIYSLIKVPEVMPRDLVVWFRTNSRPDQNRYSITNAAGTVIYSKDEFKPNTLYRDTIHLDNGCYNFRMTDDGENGISWWANNEGTGYLRLAGTDGKLIKIFNPDFGAEAAINFTVGWPLKIKEITTTEVQPIIYPNPATHSIQIDYTLIPAKKVQVKIYSITGALVKTIPANAVNNGILNVDVQSFSRGLYLLNIITENKIYSQRFELQ